MNMDEKIANEPIEHLVVELATLRPTIKELSGALAHAVGELRESDFPDAADYQRAYLTRTAYHEALTKCSIILDHNLFYIETLGVLAFTRYIFELLVWLKVLINDPDGAIEFYVQVVENQTKHLKNYEKKLCDEVGFFRTIAEEDGIPNSLMEDIANDGNSITADEVSRRIRKHQEEIDLRARRNFSLYARDAKTNGYGFQAHLIETKAIPVVQQHLLDIDKEWIAFQTKIGQSTINKIINNAKGNRLRWNWQTRASLPSISFPRAPQRW